MPRLLDSLVANAAYAFILVGVIWLGVAIFAHSLLILWPVIAFITGGIQLKLWPTGRLTWAWAISTAVMGFLISAYQVYAWAGFVGGVFSSLATASLVGFLVFAAAHVLLIFAGTSKPKEPKSTSGSRTS
jgi:hypothetical protein